MSTATSELPAGYWVDPATGAWCSIPWPTDPDERQRVAEWSLGPLLIRWAEGRLTEDEFEQFGPGLIHYQTGQPWRFTRGQKRFLILWYHFTPQGRFVYRSGVKRGAKGTGKDPFAGAHCNLELVGPSQLVQVSGDWVGRPHRMPLVQVSSNSEAQSKDVLRVANAMWSREAKDWHDLDTGETRTIVKGNGGRLEVLTASEASSEGDPATFIALNESHHMTETSGGHRVTEVARRNVGKSPKALQARLVEYTNAHSMGMDSTAERSFDSWQKQVSGKYRNMRRDILYDSIEADPGLDTAKLDDLRRGLAQAYSDAPWHDPDRLEAEILDSRTSIAETIRYYLNGLAAAEDAWISPRRFDALARPDIVVPDGSWIAMFLDCSKSEDATALVGMPLAQEHALTLGMWQRPRGNRGKDWLVPRSQVDAVVREQFDRYRIAWFGVDPGPARDDEDEALYWLEQLDAWHRDLRRKLRLWATPGEKIGHAVKFDMRLSQHGGQERNRAFTEQAERVAKMIDDDGSLTHDGDAALRIHTHNAKARRNQWGVSLGKKTRDSTDVVDLAVAMVGASLGRRIALNSGKFPKNSNSTKRRAVLA